MIESSVSNFAKRMNRINNALLLNTSFIDNLGLMNREMGICIYFFHLVGDTGNSIYEDYAEELIDEIFEEINTNTALNFENGLAGIGWGIEYLAQNGFAEADTNEVLEEFDNRLFQQLIYNTPTEIGLLNGLVEIGAYYLKRLQNSNSNDDNLQTFTNKQLLIYLIDKLDEQTKNISPLIQEPSTISLPNKEKSSSLEITPKKQIFDLVWDYPMLINFLTELHEQNIFNCKVELILERLLKPLVQEENWPQLHGNRLLLLLAIKKWTNSKLISQVNKKYATFLADVGKEKPEISREAIKNELLENNATMHYGSSGISWLYRQLHTICDNGNYLQKAIYWQSERFSFENETNAFGFLKGMPEIIHFLFDMKNYELDYNIK